MTTTTVPEVSAGDLIAIGAAVLNAVVAVQMLGHASPASTLDYMTGMDDADGADSAAALIVRDFIAWTSGRKRLAPGCDERLITFIWRSGWYMQAINRVGELVAPGEVMPPLATSA